MDDPNLTADVRDMLCAQALAVVAGSVKRLAPGRQLTVRFNSADVRQDLLAWALGRGLTASDADDATLLLSRGVSGAGPAA